MKQLTCPAGQWTILTKSNAAGMPAHYPVTLKGEPVSGRYRVFRGFLPFGIAIREAESGELKPRMEFSRGWFDASFRVELCPEADLIVHFD